MSRRHLSVAPAIALLLLLGLAGHARATTVSVEPPDTTVDVNDEFALRIVTTSFADLKGFDIVFSYDPTVLEFLGADPGDVLTGSGYSYAVYVVPDFAPPADSAWYNAAVLVGSTNGPGTLAFYRFKALAEGESPVTCRRVDFRDSDNVSHLPDCVSGLVRVHGAVPVRPTTWGRLKTLYR